MIYFAYAKHEGNSRLPARSVLLPYGRGLHRRPAPLTRFDCIMPAAGPDIFCPWQNISYSRMRIYHPHSGYHIFAQHKYIILEFVASSDKFQFEPLIRLPKLCFPLPHILYPLPKYTEKVNKSEKICKKVLDK